LLIDDILTTGATARAAAQALLRARAASVWVATLARARRSFQLRRGSGTFFEDEEGVSDQSGNALPGTLQGASIHSSHDQSSF